MNCNLSKLTKLQIFHPQGSKYDMQVTTFFRPVSMISKALPI